MMDAPAARPFVSVVVPVYNDGLRLRTCIQALERQSYPSDLYEVIVVDNGSNESVEPIVNTFQHARAVFQPKPGSYAARNKGVESSRGDVIAFTDSDCIPSENWLSKGVAHLQSVPNCGLVAGRVELFFRDPARPTIIELHSSLAAMRQTGYVKRRHFGVTANLFTFKRVLEHVGLFDPCLKSGGDRVWGQRVFVSGYEQIYAPDASVAHPAAATLGEVLRRKRRLTGGEYDIRRKQRRSGTRMMDELSAPPVRVARLLLAVYDSARPYGKRVQAEVVLFTFAVQCVALLEAVRLRLGGESQR